MGRTTFTDEQMKMLADNPNTYRVTSKVLSLTKEFKEQFYKEYQTVKREAVRPEGFSEGNGSEHRRSLEENDPYAEIKQLREKVEYLNQEMEF